MANEINCTCNIDENNVRICYPPISGGGGSGITGVGSVDYITKIKTLVGADGSAIVTIGNSDISDTTTAGLWSKSRAGNVAINLSTTNTSTSHSGALQVSDNASVLSFTASAVQSLVELTASQSRLSVGTVTEWKLTADDIIALSPNIQAGTLGWFEDNGGGEFAFRSLADGTGGQVLTTLGTNNGYIWTTVSGGGTTTNPLTIGNGLSGTSFDGSAPVTIALTTLSANWDAGSTYEIQAGSLRAKGTAGAGHLDLRYQSALPTGVANSSKLFAGAAGELGWQVDSNAYALYIDSTANTATRTLTVPDRSLTLDNITTSSTTNGTGFLKGNGSNISFDNSTYLTAAITSLNGLTGATQTFTNDTNVTIVSGGTAHVITWSGTLADARIASAATWNAKESALTFSTGLTRATNTITNNLLTGVSGGQTILSGTAATDKMILQTTSGNQTVGVSNLYTFKSGNNGANELLRIGDGIAANIGELSMWAAGQSSNTTHFLRAGTNFTYINAGTDLRLMVGANNYINMLSGAGTVAIQKPLTFASGANVTLVAGSTTLAPLVFTSGTNKTTATAGSVEYNGQFSMTPTDATRRFVVLAASATKTTAGAPYTNDGYVTLNINGSDVKFMTTA